jgi:hypothetical protein
MDPLKPNISRIYDYVLGGQHNLEADRSAAQHILKVFPAYPRWARLNREFLQLMARRWAGEGQTHILDIGSGMPTQGHFHSVLPNARILYSDNDPVTAEYARTLLGAHPAAAYLEADVRQPEALLRAAGQHFHGERKVAIGFIGVAYFIDDASLAHVMRTLHGWAAPGSVMALSHAFSEEMTETGRQQLEAFRRGGVELLLRGEAELRRLVIPWELLELAPLERWPGIETQVQASDRGDVNAGMLGLLLGRSR